MTQDEIIEIAREAGGQVTMWVNHSTIQKTTTLTFESPIDYYVSGEYPEMYHIKFLEAFANLVAAKAQPLMIRGDIRDGLVDDTPPQRTEQEPTSVPWSQALESEWVEKDEEKNT